MTDLLDLAVAAHGGLDRFNQFKTVSAHVVIGGRMWALKSQEGVMSNVRIRVTVNLHREHASLAPFKLPNQRTAFTPQRVAVETTERAVETWRRLKVKFPPRIASHSTEQIFYLGDDGLLRRHDYDVEISGNVPAAHYVYEYKDVSGIMMPTKRRVFIRQPDNTPALDPVLISIDLNDIRFA